MAKYNLALIGGGNITEYYKLGFRDTKVLKLCAIADLNPECKACAYYPNIPFFTDYRDIFKKMRIDIALICTSASTHYLIAKDILSRGISVLCEKPVCGSSKELSDLYKTAAKNNVRFEGLYHFEHGSEMRFLEENLMSIGKIQFIQSVAHERYAYNDEHIINNDKLGIGDAWRDAGSNLLSNIWHLISLTNVEKIRDITDVDPSNGTTRYTHRTFQNEKGQEFDLLIDWETMNKTKYTIIQTDIARIFIDHQEQTVYRSDQVIFCDKPNLPRMFYQYQDALMFYKEDLFNQKKTTEILEILEL